ncbi:MAG: serine--tRNA ligase [Candidatus Gracilibacteria bacterium]|nr:serine--tRNA ligase [Candidatus Gracilibacteria bacterium]MDD2908161.1 serine--tRNA ligase [Candidatus Gracilibacteria bacterium]
MIDIKILRQNPEIIRKALHDKVVKGVDLDRVIELDTKRIILKQNLDKLRERRNELSSIMPKNGIPSPEILTEAKEVKSSIQTLEKEYEEIETEFLVIYKKIPNIPSEDTPVGLTEDENVVVKMWGDIPNFSFPVKNHAEIAEVRGWIDKERAANVAGSRFAYLKGDLVRLQFALVQWVMDTLGNREVIAKIIKDNNLNVSDKPFLPILPPYMIKTAPYDAMDRLEPREDRYKIEGEDLWLQGSAEHVLGSMHAGEIFEEKDMPIRYLGYATSFRGEAGTYGKDMEGIIRMHQFDKLEMESFSVAETAHDEHLLFVGIQEYLVQQLKVPYQKIQKCTFDIGKPNSKGSDIDCWFPGQGKYRETHTADYMSDYQARRLQTRVRRTGGDVELIHTNDATAFACGRILVAIMENFQNEDYTVTIPEVLRNYMGGREIL